MKNFHLFHLVERSPWPIITAAAAWFFVTGLAFWFHRIQGGWIIIILGFFLVLFAAFFWFNDIIEEATFLGWHSKVVRFG